MWFELYTTNTTHTTNVYRIYVNTTGVLEVNAHPTIYTEVNNT